VKGSCQCAEALHREMANHPERIYTQDELFVVVSGWCRDMLWYALRALQRDRLITTIQHGRLRSFRIAPIASRP
jgi:hypothetical protein